MSSAAWPVSDFWLETPSFGPGSHDLRGKGQVVIDADGIHVVIRPRGLAGIVIPTKERRTFPMGQITGWGRTGPKVEFTAGAIAVNDSMVGGLLTTTGESLPVHVCRFTCADDKVPLAMTERLLALGLDRSRIGRH
jgi:hypothetical protein